VRKNARYPVAPHRSSPCRLLLPVRLGDSFPRLLSFSPASGHGSACVRDGGRRARDGSAQETEAQGGAVSGRDARRVPLRGPAPRAGRPRPPRRHPCPEAVLAPAALAVPDLNQEYLSEDDEATPMRGPSRARRPRTRASRWRPSLAAWSHPARGVTDAGISALARGCPDAGLPACLLVLVLDYTMLFGCCMLLYACYCC
jgi:hypothetical protein